MTSAISPHTTSPAQKPISFVGARRHDGHPAAVQTEQLTQDILDAVARLFFDLGIETASVKLFAKRGRVSERTFYARFVSKEQLYAEVLGQLVNRHVNIVGGISEEASSFEETPIEVGHHFARATLRQGVIALDRLVAAEGRKFTDPAKAYYERNFVRVLNVVTNIFGHAVQTGEIARNEQMFLAEKLLNVVFSGPLRQARLGVERPWRSARLSRYVERLVRLFLAGCRRWVVKSGGAIDCGHGAESRSANCGGVGHDRLSLRRKCQASHASHPESRALRREGDRQFWRCGRPQPAFDGWRLGCRRPSEVRRSVYQGRSRVVE
jgi:AcrR family transcriptional regulator